MGNLIDNGNGMPFTVLTHKTIPLHLTNNITGIPSADATKWPSTKSLESDDLYQELNNAITSWDKHLITYP